MKGRRSRRLDNDNKSLPFFGESILPPQRLLHSAIGFQSREFFTKTRFAIREFSVFAFRLRTEYCGIALFLVHTPYA